MCHISSKKRNLDPLENQTPLGSPAESACTEIKNTQRPIESV